MFAMSLAEPLKPVLLLVALLALGLPQPAHGETAVSGPQRSEEGFLVYTVTSEFLASPNAVEVLLPDKLEAGKPTPVLYILPVNAGTRGQWGSGIREAKQLNIHNQYGLVCVAPAFDSLPWYADHPTDPKIRQESYLLKVVLPLIESRHPVLKEPRGRLLVGFSKSGWGAFSLILRHPDVFGRAAAWDAPLMEQAPKKYGMPGIFGTQDNFDGYRIDRLLPAQAKTFTDGPARLILMGYGNFKDQTEQAHALMLTLGIPHVFENSVNRKHDWHSGWLADAVKLLMADRPSIPVTPQQIPLQ
jgi:S-formylglutathione hydrolase FrmB